MRIVLFLLMTLIGMSSYTQNVAIPDQNFEKALIDLGVDTDGEINGQILKNDAVTVISLDISNRDIKDLRGIEEFSSLMYLNCGNNNLSYVDFSKNISTIKVLNSINNINTYKNNISFLDWFDRF